MATKQLLHHDVSATRRDTHNEEEQGLLSEHASDEDDIIIHAGETGGLARQELHNDDDGDIPKTPKSANRVRFSLPYPGDEHASFNRQGHPAYNDDSPKYKHDQDYDSHIPLSGRRDSSSTSVPTSPSSGTASQHAHLLSSLYTDPSIPSSSTDSALDHLSRPKSSLRSAMSNMANSIIGAGIIGQPYALRQAGLATGIVLLVCLTVIVDWTIRLIVVNSKLCGRDTFQGTVAHCFGRPGLVAISLAQWAFAFGGMVAFGVIVGDSIPHVALAVWPGLEEMPVLGLLVDRRVVIVLFIMTVSWPLALYKDIAKLSKASTLALISMVVILVTIITQGFSVPPETRGGFDTPSLTLNSGVFQAIGVISFAFVCHHNSLLIYGSLKTPTLDRFAFVTHVSTFVSLVACLSMALAGFLTFGLATQGNVLNNFPSDNTMVNVARLCFGLNMLTTLPLEAFVCREVMFHYFMEGKPISTTLHVAVSTCLVVGAMLISLMVCDLGIVFELIGATSACALAYILPPMCYIKLSKRSWKTALAMACVVFGFVVMAISVVQSMIKLIRSEFGNWSSPGSRFIADML